MLLLMSRAFPKRFRYYVLMLLIGISFVVLAVQQQQRRVFVDINGTVYTLHTNSKTVGAALENADIYLDAADRVSPAFDAPIVADMTINITRARQLVLEIDNEIRRIYTHEETPLDIIREQGIALDEADQLYVNYIPLSAIGSLQDIQPVQHLRVIRSRSFTIIVDGEIIAQGETSMMTVGDLLAQQNIDLFLADHIEPAPNAILQQDQQISIQRSAVVKITVDGRDIQTRAVGETVADVVNAVNLPLTGEDYTIPDGSTAFTAGMSIDIVRVLEQIERQQIEIPFETISIPDPNLDIGESEVIQTGSPGLREVTTRVRREDGDVVSRTTQEPWIVIPPIDEIIAYGFGRE